MLKSFLILLAAPFLEHNHCAAVVRKKKVESNALSPSLRVLLRQKKTSEFLSGKGTLCPLRS